MSSDLSALSCVAAPASAPPWWGCPRGRSCIFAHGEEDLRREAKVAAAIARRDESQASFARQLDSYTKGMYLYSGDDAEAGSGSGGRSMLSSVLQGMKAQSESALSASSTTATASGVAGHKRSRPSTSAVVELPTIAPISLDAGKPAAVLPHATHPHSVKFAPSNWVCALSGSPSDAAIEYFNQPVVGPVAEVVGLADFASLAAVGLSVQAPPTGCACFCYEAEVVTDGVMQVGWAEDRFVASMEAGDGVGDNVHSWAFDGARCLKWNGESEVYGKPWSAGDVVRATVTLAATATAEAGGELCTATFAFSLNGEELGTAFTTPLARSVHLFPALSLEAGEVVRVGLLTPDSAGAGSCIALSSCANTTGVEIAETSPIATNQSSAASSTSPRSSTRGGRDGATAAQVPPADHSAAKRPRADVSEPFTAAATTTTHSAAAALSTAPAVKACDSIDLTTVASMEDLKLMCPSLEALKTELGRWGLKVGGTWEERACRLLAVKGLLAADVPVKLRGSNFPGPAFAHAAT